MCNDGHQNEFCNHITFLTRTRCSTIVREPYLNNNLLLIGFAMIRENIKDRNRPIKVLVSETERKELLARSQKTGLPISTFLRSAGLGLRPKTRLDGKVAMELLKVNGDLGRLGGLLKLLISEKTNVEVSDIRALLEKIDNTMDEIRRKAGSV